MNTFTNTMNDAGNDIACLYQDYHRPILAYLRRMVNDIETAEDLCQETFMKAMRSWSQHNPQARVAWLYRIATNTAYSYLRRRRRITFMPLLDDDSAATAHVLESRLDETEPVQAALAQIPEHYRALLLLSSYEGRSTQEIAEELGCSSGAVKMRLFRARKYFREVYQA